MTADVPPGEETWSLPPTAPLASHLQPGDRVGPYVIREQIGEGGFAVVYAAEQERPVRRRVALKMIKLGMDTRQVIARFEAERQALAMMNHPHIAKVFDAGATESGRPYFVMELVPGEPITGYCDKHRLSTARRLNLFIQACDAVQHAHQKGIIHRDIKPSNVLVSLDDGSPQVKVIDFGVAKAVSQRLTERTVYTEHGMLIGTPEYMSPEQAEMSGIDVDTRTDVYSLGVLLYELLAGALPFDPEALRRAGYGEIQRIIREEEPAAPSTRLSGLRDKSAEVARQHDTDPRSLLRELRGELDGITMKAIAKDRILRYAAASELSADLRRYLNGDPVEAHGPGFGYTASKLIRKEKGKVIAVVLMLAMLFLGCAALTWRLERAQWTQASRAASLIPLQAELGQRLDALQQLTDYPPSSFDELLSTPCIRDLLKYHQSRRRGRTPMTDAQALASLLGYGPAPAASGEQIRQHFGGLDDTGWSAALAGFARSLPSLEAPAGRQPEIAESDLSAWDITELLSTRDELWRSLYGAAAPIPGASITVGIAAVLLLVVAGAIYSTRRWMRTVGYLAIAIVALFAPFLMSVANSIGRTPITDSLLPYFALLVAVSTLILVAVYQDDSIWMRTSIALIVFVTILFALRLVTGWLSPVVALGTGLTFILGLVLMGVSRAVRGLAKPPAR